MHVKQAQQQTQAQMQMQAILTRVKQAQGI